MHLLVSSFSLILLLFFLFLLGRTLASPIADQVPFRHLTRNAAKPAVHTEAPASPEGGKTGASKMYQVAAGMTFGN
jgi:hypothetical protein